MALVPSAFLLHLPKCAKKQQSLQVADDGFGVQFLSIQLFHVEMVLRKLVCGDCGLLASCRVPPGLLLRLRPGLRVRLRLRSRRSRLRLRDLTDEQHS